MLIGCIDLGCTDSLGQDLWNLKRGTANGLFARLRNVIPMRTVVDGGNQRY